MWASEVCVKPNQELGRRFWSLVPCTRATHFGASLLTHSHFDGGLGPVEGAVPEFPEHETMVLLGILAHKNNT